MLTPRDVPAIPILPQNTQWLLSWQLPPLGLLLSLKIYGKPQIPSPLGSPQPISRWHSWPGPGITDHGLSPLSLTMLSRVPVQAAGFNSGNLRPQHATGREIGNRLSILHICSILMKCTLMYLHYLDLIKLKISICTWMVFKELYIT